MGILDRRAQHVCCLLARIFIPDMVSLAASACKDRSSLGAQVVHDAIQRGRQRDWLLWHRHGDFTYVARQLGERTCPLP
jgi:hypothetical protein